MSLPDFLKLIVAEIAQVLEREGVLDAWRQTISKWDEELRCDVAAEQQYESTRTLESDKPAYRSGTLRAGDLIPPPPVAPPEAKFALLGAIYDLAVGDQDNVPRIQPKAFEKVQSKKRGNRWVGFSVLKKMVPGVGGELGLQETDLPILEGYLQSVRRNLDEKLGVEPDDGSRPARRKRRGRKKATPEQEQEESALAEEWKRARDNGTCKKDFAAEKGMKLREFNAVLERVRKRQ